MALDEYGDVPGHGGNQYAEIDTMIDDANPHISGTIPHGTSLTFWLSQPRPRGISYERWERHTQDRWDKAFK